MQRTKKDIRDKELWHLKQQIKTYSCISEEGLSVANSEIYDQIEKQHKLKIKLDRPKIQVTFNAFNKSKAENNQYVFDLLGFGEVNDYKISQNPNFKDLLENFNFGIRNMVFDLICAYDIAYTTSNPQTTAMFHENITRRHKYFTVDGKPTLRLSIGNICDCLDSMSTDHTKPLPSDNLRESIQRRLQRSLILCGSEFTDNAILDFLVKRANQKLSLIGMELYCASVNTINSYSTYIVNHNDLDTSQVGSDLDIDISNNQTPEEAIIVDPLEPTETTVKYPSQRRVHYLRIINLSKFKAITLKADKIKVTNYEFKYPENFYDNHRLSNFCEKHQIAGHELINAKFKSLRPMLYKYNSLMRYSPKRLVGYLLTSKRAFTFKFGKSNRLGIRFKYLNLSQSKENYDIQSRPREILTLFTMCIPAVLQKNVASKLTRGKYRSPKLKSLKQTKASIVWPIAWMDHS